MTWSRTLLFCSLGYTAVASAQPAPAPTVPPAPVQAPAVPRAPPPAQPAPPGAQPPGTQPPTTAPPGTQPPTTAPPGTQPPATAPPAAATPGAPGTPPAPYPAPLGPQAYPYQQPAYGPQPAFVEPPPPVNPWPEPDEPSHGKLRLAALTEAAFGADEGPFYNHLVSARADYRASYHSSFGLLVGYANLKGRVGRVHSVLGYAQYEYRFYFGDHDQIGVPMRAALGHLVNNGVVVRFGTGIYYAISERVDIGADLIAPMFWTASNDTVISLNVAPEVSFTF